MDNIRYFLSSKFLPVRQVYGRRLQIRGKLVCFLLNSLYQRARCAAQGDMIWCSATCASNNRSAFILRIRYGRVIEYF
ncbi:hypothetical protein CS542_07130 [Pedobacter sp. IW39]|nr:hypothetical protein CS542_07130 [Pedobacter sp. IW39]